MYLRHDVLNACWENLVYIFLLNVVNVTEKQSSNDYGYEDERLSHYFIFDFKSVFYGFWNYFLCFIESQQSNYPT
jgi:hypothetical protein